MAAEGFNNIIDLETNPDGIEHEKETPSSGRGPTSIFTLLDRAGKQFCILISVLSLFQVVTFRVR